MSEPLVNVKNLKVTFSGNSGEVVAVNDVSFEIYSGEILGLVGESGCGKSVTALSLMRLLPNPPGKIAAGRIEWKGTDLLQLPTEEMIAMRGKDIAMVFQEPLTAFNPVQSIGHQLAETLHIHEDIGEADARQRVLEMLHRVGLSDPERQYDAFPYELSGGMRQRAMIAMALLGDSQLLIADEPTTALDVTIQAQILDLIRELQIEKQMSVLLITHNLGAVAEVADRVAVMYAGRLVEVAEVKEFFTKPLHPYSFGLLKSIPSFDDVQELYTIPGQVPDMRKVLPGCAFAERCSRATERCKAEQPELLPVSDGHLVACFNQE